MNFTFSNIRSSIIFLINQNRVKIVINIDNFLNSIEKRINDHKKDIFDAIIKQYTSIEIRDHETDEEKKITSKITYTKAFSHLNQLRLYKEQQNYNDSEMIRGLNKYEKAVRGRGHDVHRQQASITSYFDR